MKKKMNNYFGKLMVFSKWSGKSNSAFLSLKRQVKISVLSVAYFLLNTFTTEAQIDTIKIDEIRISGYRTELTLSKVPRMVTVITGTDLNEAPINSIHDALKTLMNIDVRDRGAFGVQSDLNIRGGSFEQNVVLINGIRMNDPQTGHFQMNLPLDLVDVKRIEYLAGSSSSLFGNNAFGGAINIITGLNRENSAKLSLSTGEHAYFGTNLSVNLSSKLFKNYLSISKRISEGHIENTDFNIFNVFYNAKIITKPGELQLQAGFLDKSFGANNFYTPVYPEQYEQNKTWLANIRYVIGSQVRIIPSFYWRRNTDRFELFRNEAPAWYKSHNYHLTDVLGAEINSLIKVSNGQWAFGFEWNRESILSNKLGDLLEQAVAIKNLDSVSYTYGKSRQNLNFFIENQFQLSRFSLISRIMVNHNSMFGWNFYPGIDALYVIGDKLRLVSSVNWSGRIPSFTDLYYVGPTNKGNIDLLPEKAISSEIGLKYKSGIISGQSAVFYRQGRQIIDWVKYHKDSLWESSNITEIDTWGFEMSLKFDFNSKYGKDFFIKTLNIAYTYLSADKNSDIFISKYVLDYLRHHLNFSVTHQIRDFLTLNWSITFQDRNGSYLPYNQLTKSFDPARDFKPFFLADIKLAYNRKPFEFYIQLKNIFNIKTQNIENVELPGRWTIAGITFDVDLFKEKQEQKK